MLVKLLIGLIAIDRKLNFVNSQHRFSNAFDNLYYESLDEDTEQNYDQYSPNRGRDFSRSDDSFFLKSNPTKKSDQIKIFESKKEIKLCNYYPKSKASRPSTFSYGKQIGQSNNSKTKSNKSESMSSKRMINISKSLRN